MKEVRFWEAEDGTQFESEYDCEEYERHLRYAKLLEIVPCYNQIFVRTTGEDEGFDESDICYIFIPDMSDTDFAEALRELDEYFFEGQLPYIGAKTHNDLLYWDEDSQSWRVWSKDYKELRQMIKYFQLFGEGE